MKQKGFTLVEVLGVLVVLALIFILCFPNVVDRIIKGEDSIDEASKKVVLEAAKDYVSENDINRQLEKYCISVEKLLDEGYITEGSINDSTREKDVEITISKTRLDYDVVEQCTITSGNVISLVGSQLLEVPLNGTYNEQGALATDKDLNDISSQIVTKIFNKDGIAVNSIDTTSLGLFHIEYSINYNGIEDVVYRDVKIVDKIKPVITLTESAITISSSVTNFNLFDGVSVSDNSGEVLTVTVRTDLALGAPGTYTITYSATDSSGNTASINKVVIVIKANTL